MNKHIPTRNELILINRRKQLRRRVISTIVFTSLLVIILVLLNSDKSFASDGSVHEYYKHYKSIIVSSDMNIWSLAEEYSIEDVLSEDRFVSEVMFMNNMDSYEFPDNSSIIIPYFDTVTQF